MPPLRFAAQRRRTWREIIAAARRRKGARKRRQVALFDVDGNVLFSETGSLEGIGGGDWLLCLCMIKWIIAADFCLFFVPTPLDRVLLAIGGFIIVNAV
jgi:hypothetical protein